MKYKLQFLIAGVVAIALSAAHADTYKIDPVHSGVSFKIRHLFSEVPGRFNDFSGTIEYKPDAPEQSSVEATIQIASIDTANEKRDGHLRSGDFFDVEKFPTMTFKSTKIEKTGEDSGKLTGDLTMHGVTKPVTLDVKFLGKGAGMEGDTRAGWKGTTTLNRKEFGLEWNKIIEGTSVLGDEVEISINLEAFAEK